MNVIQMRVQEITPYERNAKKHPEEQVEHIANSIREFGWQQPLVVDKDNVLVIGHGRLMAAKKLGLEQVPVVRADDLTEQQIAALRLADNKTNESGWDFELLDMELEGIDQIDMTMFGFELFDEDEEEPQIKEDEVPDVPEEVIAKPGDVFQLGRHRLMCGDSTSTDDVDTLMDGAVADMVFTDPPYGMKKESEGVLNDNLNYDDLLEFNREWIPLSLGALKDTGCWYCWGIDEPLMDIYSNILKPMKKANQIVIRNYITWAKHSAFGINSDLSLSYPKESEKCWFIMKGMDWNNNNMEFFNTKYERILEYMQGEAAKANLDAKKCAEVCGVSMYQHWFSKSQFAIISEKHYDELRAAFPGCFTKPYKELREMLGFSNNPTADLKPYFDSSQIDDVGSIGLTDVWRFPPTSNKEREGLNHATPKPIALCCRAIHASSREDEIVLDLFGGSGSTMIACEQLGRSCYMMEMEPKYCDVIIKRWENFTGKKAELIG